MDLKLKVKDNFFKNYPKFTIDTTKISIACFLGVFICLIISDYASNMYYFDLLSCAFFSLRYAAPLTALVYFVALAIEHDMFKTKNAKPLLDKLLIISIAVVAVVFISSYIQNISYYLSDLEWYAEYILSFENFLYPIFDAIAAFLLVFFFGQILAISIENGVKFNKNFPQKVTTIIFISFLVVFGFKTAHYFSLNSFYFIWLGDAVAPLFTSIAFTIPVLLMGYALSIYLGDNQQPQGSGLKRVAFGDDFSIELPEYNASLPNYGFEVQPPVEENFGELKQWFGGNVSIKYFSFKNEEIKNEIMEDMKNIPGMQRVNHAKYIIQKDAAQNIVNVFYFKDNQALNLFGNDMNLLLTLMDSVQFGKIQQNVVPATPAPVQAAAAPSQPAASSSNGIMPLKEKGLSLPASPVCDVCNKRLDVDKSWFVPNKVFYGSQKYRQWNRSHFPLSETESEFNLRMSMMEANDPTEGSAVCEDCIHMFR